MPKEEAGRTRMGTPEEKAGHAGRWCRAGEDCHVKGGGPLVVVARLCLSWPHLSQLWSLLPHLPLLWSWSSWLCAFVRGASRSAAYTAIASPVVTAALVIVALLVVMDVAATLGVAALVIGTRVMAMIFAAAVIVAMWTTALIAAALFVAEHVAAVLVVVVRVMAVVVMATIIAAVMFVWLSRLHSLRSSCSSWPHLSRLWPCVMQPRSLWQSLPWPWSSWPHWLGP